jgi:hypothetical protein
MNMKRATGVRLWLSFFLPRTDLHVQAKKINLVDESGVVPQY